MYVYHVCCRKAADICHLAELQFFSNTFAKESFFRLYFHPNSTIHSLFAMRFPLSLRFKAVL